MKTSIIIPCYNCGKTIQETINSLLKQKPFEIICVDDGSTDNTREVIKKNKVKYLFQKNSGPAKARNTGAKKALGEIIIFIDSDCVPKKKWLEEMLKPFEDKNVVGVQGAYKTKQKEIIARFVQEEIEERYKRMKNSKKLDWVGSYSAAFRKKEFLLAGGYDDESFPIASGEDPEFSFRLIEKTNMKLVFNDKAIVYHLHPTSLKKYLKVKYFRAVYRPKMYSSHENKILKDSYTPQKIKIEIILFYITIVLFFLGFFNNLVWIGILGTIILHILLEFSFIIKIKENNIKLVAGPITILRTIVFGTGLIHGIIN
jgi:glycosyltransferase involved in cell wall biosynthesis